MGVVLTSRKNLILFCLIVCTAINVQGSVLRDTKTILPTQLQEDERSVEQKFTPVQYQLIQQLLQSQDNSYDDDDLQNQLASASSQKFEPRVARYSMGDITHVGTKFKDQLATNALLNVLGRDNQPSNACLDNAMPMVKDINDLVFAFKMCF